MTWRILPETLLLPLALHQKTTQRSAIERIVRVSDFFSGRGDALLSPRRFRLRAEAKSIFDSARNRISWLDEMRRQENGLPLIRKKTRKRRIHYTFSNRRIGNDFPVDRTCNCAGVRHAFSLERDADTLDVGALSGTRGHHLSGSARWKKKSHRRDWQGAARTDVQTLQPNNRAARGASKRPKSKKIAPW